MRNNNRQQVKKVKHPLGQTKRKTTGKNMKGTNCESTKVSQKVKQNCVQVSKWRSCSKHISEIVVCGPSLNHCMLKPRKTVKGPSDLAVFRRQSSVLS